MHRIDHATAAASLPAQSAPGTPGYFQAGNPVGGIPATVVTPDIMNALVEENCAVIADAGITLDKANNAQLLAALNVIARIRLKAATTIYVSTSGNDTTGDGSVGAPFATLQKAWDYCQQRLDLRGYQLTIQLANGTYTAVVNLLGMMVGQGQNTPVIIQGNTGSPSSVVLTNSSNAGTLNVRGGARVTIKGVRISATGGSLGHAILATEAGFAQFETVEFAATSGAHVAASIGGIVYASGNYSIVGTANYHWFIDTGGYGQQIARTITITTAVSFAAAFAYVTMGGRLDGSSCTFVNPGNVSGARYVTGGWLNTNGSGGSYFPGTIAGSVTGYGIYT